MKRTTMLFCSLCGAKQAHPQMPLLRAAGITGEKGLAALGEGRS